MTERLIARCATAARHARRWRSAPRPRPLTPGRRCSAPTTSASTPQRVALAYPGHPGGPLREAVELAVAGKPIRARPAGLQRAARGARRAQRRRGRRAACAQLEKAGAGGAVLDLPARLDRRARRPPPAAAAQRRRERRRAAPAGLPRQPVPHAARASACAPTRWRRHCWRAAGRACCCCTARRRRAARLALAQAALKRYGLKAVARQAFQAARPIRASAISPTRCC